MPASTADASLNSNEALMLLERKLLDLAFGKVKFSVISALLLASLIVIALWSVIEHERLLAWLAGIAVVKALHVLYLHRYKRHGHRADVHPGKWEMGLVAGAAAAGLGWGCAVFCFPSSPFNPMTLFGVFILPSTPFDPVTVLLIFILAGVTAYASVALAFVPLAAFAFFACAWLPLAIWLFSFGEQMYVVMGLIALSYLGVMVMLSRRMHATVCSLISVTEENMGLRTAQQENERRMQRFFESAPGFFYTACMTPDGKSFMPFASAGIHELFDLAPGEVADSMSSMFALVRSEDIERVINEREASRRNLSPFRIEFRINHRIKGERWIELNSLPQREPDGSTNWHGFMQDITERRRLEESVAASEREFRTLAENFPDVVIRYGLDGRRTYVNRALAELAGAEPGEMLGKFRENTPLVDPEAYTAELHRVIATRDAADLEVAARGANGEISWYQARFVPEFDAGNNVSGVLMVAGDITERRRMELELQRREADFRTLAENLPVAVIRYDAEQRRSYLNPAAERMLHGDATQMLGQVPGEGGVPATPEMIALYRGKMAEVLASGEVREFEFAMDALPLERQERYEVRMAPEYGEDGKIVGTLTTWFDVTERKRMEEELMLKEQVLDQAHEGVYLIDERARFVYVNDQACRELGYSRDELLGMGVGDIDHAKSDSDSLAVREQSLKEGAFAFETQHHRRDGSLFPVEIQASTLVYRGKHLGLALARNISERKRAEAALAARERDFRSLADNIPDNVARWDTQGRYLYLNPAHERTLGRSAQEVLGKSLAEIIGDAHLSGPSGLDLVIATGKPALIEHFPIPGENGETRFHDIQSVPEFDAEGRIVSVLGIGRDMTDSYRMQEAIAAREQEFRSLAESSPDFIVRYDRAGRARYLNSSLVRLLGLGSADEAIGKRPSERWPDGRFDSIEQAAARAVEKGEEQVIELVRPREKGEFGYSQIFVVPERDANGDIVGTIAFGRDITGIKRIEERLKEAQRIAHVGSWDVDMVNDRLTWSDEIFRIWEIDKTKFRADFAAFLETVHPEDRERVNRVYNEAVANHTLYEVEHRLLFPDGRVKHILERGEPQYDEQGKPVRFIGTSLDITERKRFEQALQERGDLLHAVMESSPEVIVFALDANYRYLSFNGKHKQVMQAIWGKEIAVGMSMPDEVIGSHADRELARRGFDRALSGESFVEENAYGDEALSREYWQTFWSPIRSSAGEVTGLTCFVLNISERRRMDESLRRSEQLMRTVVDATPDWVFIKDKEHRYRLANKGYADALHIAPEDFIGKDDLDLGFPEELVKGDPEKGIRGFWADDRLVLDSNEMQVYPDDPATIDGEVHTFHTIKVPLRDADGKPWGVLAFARDISERKRSELALCASEEKIRSLYELSPLGIALTDMQGRYVEFNEAFRAICGYPADELTTLDYWTLTPREYEAKEALQLESLAQTGRYGPYEKEYRQKDGTLVPIQLNGMLVTGKDGKQYIWSIVEDITERKQTEAVLKERFERILELNDYLEENSRTLEEHAVELEASQEQLKEALEFSNGVINAIPDILFEMDREGRYHGIWTQQPALLAAQKAALLNKTVHEVLPLETADAALAAIREADEYGAAYGKVIAIAQPDGETRWFEHSISRKHGGSPSDTRFIVLSRDVTDRKQVEESLRESYDKISELNRHLEKNAEHLEENARYLEEQATELEASQGQLKQTEAWYRSILHSAPEGMLVVDDQGLIMQVNARLEAMFGYASGELPGHRVEELLPRVARETHAVQRGEYFSSGVASRPAMVGKTLFGCRKDGSTFPVDVSLARLPEVDGRRSAVCASVRDITERQAMEAARETALAEAQRLAQLRSAFMAQMSHELRTPLNGILGYAQNLLQGDALGEKQVAGLNIIQHSGEHLLSLINGLLDHAAIEANKFELIEGDIELDSFLSAIIGIIRVRAEQKNLAFTCEAGGDLPAVVRGDAQRLRQVLINLLANAVKFTDSGDVILRVRLAAPTRIRFEVKDSGVGIAADQLENIFLPFEQTGELQRRAGGSGLGLSISRTLVRLMGGDIQVESRPGAGSVFSFEIEVGVVQSGRAGLDAAALSERAETRAAQATPMLPAPPRHELDTLHALALRGSMRDVTRHADKLAEADERYQPFAAQLRRLAQSFQTKALLGLIEQYRNREQEK